MLGRALASGVFFICRRTLCDVGSQAYRRQGGAHFVNDFLMFLSDTIIDRAVDQILFWMNCIMIWYNAN